jgi:hypothetical protein
LQDSDIGWQVIGVQDNQVDDFGNLSGRPTKQSKALHSEQDELPPLTVERTCNWI